MIIVQDSREQEGKHTHILTYLEEQNIKVVRSKLFVGDYTLLNNQSVCIDTKKDVLELFMDLTKDHIRFRNECIRAKENGIQLIILVEEELPNHNLAEWVSPVWKANTPKHKKGEKKTQANPATMRKAMITMQEEYGVKFLFCNRKDTPKIIVNILSKGE